MKTYILVAVIAVVAVYAGWAVLSGDTVAPTPTVSVADSVAPTVTPTPTVTPVVSVAASPSVNAYTMTQVAVHADAKSCWTVVRGNVYDVTSFITKHPGGAEKVLAMCGKDATAAFEGKHDGQEKPEMRLDGLEIGILK